VRGCKLLYPVTLLYFTTSLEKLKRGSDPSTSPKTLSCGEKIAKIGLVDPEIIGLNKKEDITEGKIGLAYIARWASLPNGVNNI